MYKSIELAVSSVDMAKVILEKMNEAAEKYGYVSVADYNDLIGLFSTSLSDHTVGWSRGSLSGIVAEQTDDGYLIKFPPVVDLAGQRIEVQHAVRLDMTKILTGENEGHTLKMAESLLNICGVIKVWDKPNTTDHRIFYVRSIPKDIPQAGIYWIDETIVSPLNNPMKGGETES